MKLIKIKLKKLFRIIKKNGKLKFLRQKNSKIIINNNNKINNKNKLQIKKFLQTNIIKIKKQ